MFGTIEANHNFVRQFRPYLVEEWNTHYFPYDHFKSVYDLIKSHSAFSTCDNVSDFVTQFHDQVRKVHRFLMWMIRQVLADIITIRELLGVKEFDFEKQCHLFQGPLEDVTCPEYLEEDREEEGDDDYHRTKSGVILPSLAPLADTYANRSVELSLRNLYQRIHQLELFYKLNFYCIRKISKKIDKLLSKDCFSSVAHALVNVSLQSSPTAQTSARKSMINPALTLSSSKQWWKYTDSGRYFYEEFSQSKVAIDELNKQCIWLYMSKFRSTYTDLAVYELDFVKEKDRTSNWTKLLLGIKIGLVLCICIWVLVDAFLTTNDLDFWQQAGLFVYTMIGNLLLYRMTWAFNIYLWSTFDINYISILRLSNNKSNLLLVSNQTASLLVLYFLNILIFLRANSSDALQRNSFFSYGTPFVLLMAALVYQIYEYFYLFGGKRVSRGIFTRGVLRHCLMAPFAPISFRDVYAADVLTSFTRTISDSLYASCWVISGAFLRPHDTKENQTITSYSDFGSSYMTCTGNNMVITASLVQMLPLVTRTLQCLRSCRDQDFKLFPQGYNALKYLLSILVVIIGLTDSSNEALYFFLIALSTLYKWWWDVVMDWGLLDRWPQSVEELLNVWRYGERKMFLRESLMYPHREVYYVCMLLDLLLRFLWVLSTLPSSTLHGLVGYQLSFFLGSMEILRRCMWGVFRVEWEHLKMIRAKSPGFLTNRVMRYTKRMDSDSDEESSKKIAKLNMTVPNQDIAGKTLRHSVRHEEMDSDQSLSFNPLQE